MNVLRNNSDDEKYRIKPRKKYARQVWLQIYMSKCIFCHVMILDFDFSLYTLEAL